MIALEDLPLEDPAEPMFRPVTVWTVYVLYAVGGSALYLLWLSKSTALLEPIDPRFHAGMMATGAFAGVWIAAVVREAWRMGITLRGPVPQVFVALLELAALVAGGAFSGGFLADLAVEWRSFRSIDPQARAATFEVLDHHWNSSGPDWLDLRTASDSYSFSINCGFRTCSGVEKGDQLRLPVQTGRDGFERVVIPARLRDHLLRR